MDAHVLGDPVFVAKVVDFVIFAIAVVVVYQKYGNPWLVSQQEAQNKAVEDAQAEVARSAASVEEARQAIDKAKTDAVRMVEVGKAQAQRLVTDEIAQARDHAQRVLAHANGELERERYRVRRELLEDTVERATQSARDIALRELTPARQEELVQGVIGSLEAQRA